MNKKLSLIIALQALLIIVLFWVLIFYSKDEYEAYQNRHEDEIASPNRVAEIDGMSIVSLSAATQQNSGITTTKVVSSTFVGKLKSTGTVIAIDRLIEAKANYLQAKSEIALANAASGNNLQQYQRLKTLNEDDKNVSDRAVQEALAAVNSDKAKISAAELQLNNLKSAVKLEWGEALSSLVFDNKESNDKTAPHLANLLNRKNVLVQVSFPLEFPTPKLGSALILNPLNAGLSPVNTSDAAIKAIYVSPAAHSDANGYGKTFYYSAPAESLRIGMRVNTDVDASGSKANNGVVIPNQALVWYGGKSWAYFKLAKNKQGEDQFARKPINADIEVSSGADSGWFNQGIDVQREVVVSGAQLLLSEEFKNQIKNENGD